MAHDLSPVEVRVLGALVEKEMATPQNYPLTRNALRTACNQTTGRDPVVSYDDGTVERALADLRAAGWTRIVYSPSNRAPKYRHVIDELLGLSEAEVAVLAVLMLRGPQTPGEVKARTERMWGFASVAEVDEVLSHLASVDDPLVRRLPHQPGQKEARWVHRLSGDGGPAAADQPPGGDTTSDGERVGAAVTAAVTGDVTRAVADADPVSPGEGELDSLRHEVEALRGEVEALAASLREVRTELGMS